MIDKKNTTSFFFLVDSPLNSVVERGSYDARLENEINKILSIFLIHLIENLADNCIGFQKLDRMAVRSINGEMSITF